MVFFSLVVQGLSVKTLIRFLGVNPKVEAASEYEYLITKIHQFEAAIEEIHKVRKRLFITESLSNELVKEYEDKKGSVEKQIQKLYQDHTELKENQKKLLLRQALYAEYEAVSELTRDDVISNEVADKEHAKIMDVLVNLDEEH